MVNVALAQRSRTSRFGSNFLSAKALAALHVKLYLRIDLLLVFSIQYCDTLSSILSHQALSFVFFYFIFFIVIWVFVETQGRLLCIWLYTINIIDIQLFSLFQSSAPSLSGDSNSSLRSDSKVSQCSLTQLPSLTLLHFLFFFFVRSVQLS